MVLLVVVERGEKVEIPVAIAVVAACRSAGSDTAFAAIAANAGSAGNPLFPTDLAFGQRQRTRKTPSGEVEEEDVEEKGRRRSRRRRRGWR